MCSIASGVPANKWDRPYASSKAGEPSGASKLSASELGSDWVKKVIHTTSAHHVGSNIDIFSKTLESVRPIRKSLRPEPCPMMIRLIGVHAQKRCALSRN